MYINIISSIGIIFILIATLIITVIIRNLLARIEVLSFEIRKFDYGRQMFAINNVLYETQKVSRQLYLFECNIVGDKNQDYRNTLIRNILDKFRGLISEYTGLFGGYKNLDVKEIQSQAMNEYKGIINDKSITFNEKFKKLDNLINYYTNEFIKVFNIKQEENRIKKDSIKKMKKKKDLWNVAFNIFQISGLVLITIPEYINNFYLIVRENVISIIF